MTKFHVTWEADIEATSMREAAEKAMERQRDVTLGLPTFAVRPAGRGTRTLFIDLDDAPEPCGYTHSHTREFCGNPDCRES